MLLITSTRPTRLGEFYSSWERSSTHGNDPFSTVVLPQPCWRQRQWNAEAAATNSGIVLLYSAVSIAAETRAPGF